MVLYGRKTTFDAGAVRFVVQHELWDGNIEDHSDQGVAILVTAQAGGKETTLLRFNCFDLERSYVYGPEPCTDSAAWILRWTATPSAGQ